MAALTSSAMRQRREGYALQRAPEGGAVLVMWIWSSSHADSRNVSLGLIPKTEFAFKPTKQSRICRRECIVPQFVTRHPGERRATERLRFVGQPATAEELEQHRL